MITVVITSCGRLGLLKGTTDSFLRFNTHTISEYIIVDDSGDSIIHDKLRQAYPYWTLILNPNHRGQVECIDDAYSHVKTPYIFHCEDDWEFLVDGFMDLSQKILEQNKKVMLVALNDLGLPIEPEVFKAGEVEYRLIGNDANNWWHGFTWNPSLRRLSEYELVKPYIQYAVNVNSAVTECRIGIELYDKYGYKAAILNDVYCYHTGIKDQKRII